MRAIRPLLLGALLVAAAGCPATSNEDLGAAPDGDPDNNPGSAVAECSAAGDCTAAGDSCCTCPTFAVPKSSGWDDSCEDVSCDEPTGCSTEPACEQGQCVLRCVEVGCEPTSRCEAGFARDEAGCLTCSCAEQPDPAAGECAVDDDCVQVPADCCGCAEGGEDTAVPESQAADFANGLGCDGSTSCPGVNVCDSDAVPRCIAGQCELPGGSDDGESPPDGGSGAEPLRLCGTPELAPCAETERCVVNDPEAPVGMNVGVCRLP